MRAVLTVIILHNDVAKTLLISKFPCIAFALYTMQHPELLTLLCCSIICVCDVDNIHIPYTGGHISKNANFGLKHSGVPDSCDSSAGTSNTLSENFTLPVVQGTVRVSYVPPLLCGDVYASSE